MAVRERATYEDLLQVPEHLVAELIDGDLQTSPRPSGLHGRGVSALIMDIGPAYDRGRGGPGGWWIIFEPELHLGENVLVPDIGGWRRERMPEVPKNQIFGIPPDWVCEALSGSTERIDRTRKMPIYARNAIPYAWLIDPVAQTLEVKRLEDGRWSDIGLYGGDDKFHAEPFDLVEIDLGSIWGAPPS